MGDGRGTGGDRWLRIDLVSTGRIIDQHPPPSIPANGSRLFQMLLSSADPVLPFLAVMLTLYDPIDTVVTKVGMLLLDFGMQLGRGHRPLISEESHNGLLKDCGGSCACRAFLRHAESGCNGGLLELRYH